MILQGYFKTTTVVEANTNGKLEFMESNTPKD